MPKWKCNKSSHSGRLRRTKRRIRRGRKKRSACVNFPSAENSRKTLPPRRTWRNGNQGRVVKADGETTYWWTIESLPNWYSLSNSGFPIGEGFVFYLQAWINYASGFSYGTTVIFWCFVPSIVVLLCGWNLICPPNKEML